MNTYYKFLGAGGAERVCVSMEILCRARFLCSVRGGLEFQKYFRAYSSITIGDFGDDCKH